MNLGYTSTPGKWLRLLVAGPNVKPELAEEIILRTARLELLHTNDKAWRYQIANVLGLEIDDIGYFDYKSAKEYVERVDGLDLHWLTNHDRIASSWIGGPHGWVDWDGHIGCNSYNLGKYPGLDEITEDLLKIAATWSQLMLWVQLVDSEGDGPTVGEWKIDKGVIERFDPPTTRHITTVMELDPDAMATSLVTGAHSRERGVDLEKLRVAYARTRRDL